MQEAPGQRQPQNPYRSVGIVVSLCLHLLLLGLFGLSCLTRKPPQPPLPIDVEFLELPGGGAAPAPQAPQPEPQPEPPKPEPEPQPEPPKPEPEPQPDPPKPEPEPQPEPPKPEPEPQPEPPKPKKPEPPKPKKPEPPKPKKPKKPTLEERLRNAQIAKPEKPKAPQKSTKELERQLQERMRRSESNLTRPSVSAPSGGNPNPGLRGAQLNAYQNYLVSCLQPAMQPLWEELGPEALRNAPRPVQVTVTITPEGRLLLGVVSRPSDVDAMNRAAQALLQRMQGMQLPPLSRTGLPTQGSLKFVVNLEYRLQTSR